jgi:hypothetical protein
MSFRHLLPLLLVALAAAPHASAQYQWRDANGRMVYSDMPPPASVPPSAVQRAPARQTPAGTSGGSGAAASAPAAAPVPAAASATPAPTLADREMEFRKRRMEREAAERKAAEAEAQSQRAAAACEDSRAQVRALESGMRVARVNERGEREFIDDTTRASQLEAARKSVREFCRS